MRQVFLRVQKQNDCSEECHYYDEKKCPARGLALACIGFDGIFIEDTIIPQKLALYEEIVPVLKRIVGSRAAYGLLHHETRSDISRFYDRAKKIEEATR